MTEQETEDNVNVRTRCGLATSTLLSVWATQKGERTKLGTLLIGIKCKCKPRENAKSLLRFFSWQSSTIACSRSTAGSRNFSRFLTSPLLYEVSTTARWQPCTHHFRATESTLRSIKVYRRDRIWHCVGIKVRHALICCWLAWLESTWTYLNPSKLDLLLATWFLSHSWSACTTYQ